MSDIATLFFRGQELLFTEPDATLFNANISSTPDGRVKWLPEPRCQIIERWKWCSSDKRGDTGSRGCGTALFGGIEADLGRMNRSPGPVFHNNDCPDVNRRKINLDGNYYIASPEQVRSFCGSRAEQTLQIDVNLQFSAVPYKGDNRLGPNPPHMPIIECNLGCLGSGDPVSRIIDCSTYEWKPGELSLRAAVVPQKLIDSSDIFHGLVVGFLIVGREVQFNSLRCQLLNPF